MSDHPSLRERHQPYVAVEDRADQRIWQLYHLQEVHWRCPTACPCRFHRSTPERHTGSIRQIQPSIDKIPTNLQTPKTDEVPAVSRDTQELHLVVSKPLYLKQLIMSAVGEYGHKHGYLPGGIEIARENYEQVLPFFPTDWKDGYPVGDVDHTYIAIAPADDLDRHTVRCLSVPLELPKKHHQAH